MFLSRRASLVLLLLAACSGEAATSMPAAAPVSPPAVVTISAPTTVTAMPSALPALPAHPASAEPPKLAGESYEPSVQMGNTTALNTARVPFATYLNAIHQRVHPIFTDQFLAGLANLPASHPLNQALRTDVEIVIDHRTGKLVRMGIIRPSGVAAFDVAVTDAVTRAQPFGPAPDIISSPDGNVYLHWEFHRDPMDACSTRNARPYLLKSPP